MIGQRNQGRIDRRVDSSRNRTNKGGHGWGVRGGEVDALTFIVKGTDRLWRGNRTDGSRDGFQVQSRGGRGSKRGESSRTAGRDINAGPEVRRAARTHTAA